MNKYLFILLLILTFTSQSVLSMDETRLLRFPAIYENQIVFTYAGDLYTVDAAGGVARKLTSHSGYEMFARFSPDGKTIAFTGQYDGNTEIFTIPAEGGVPKRITYTATLGRDDISDRMGPNNITMGWMHDSKTIVFRSRKNSFNSFNGSLFTVTVDGEIPKQIPLPRGGFCSFSPDDTKMAYNRIFREFRTWKRYRGGMADDIWIYDFKTKNVENLTKNDAQDIIPMWKGNKIYFLSDRDANKRMNLYVADTETGRIKQLTSYSDYDIKFPSLGENAIVYEYGGYIYKFDLDSESAEKITIYITDDLLTGRNELRDVKGNTTNYEISPDGKRALLGAHGDVFTVPAKHGEIRNLTNTPGIHERNSKWSPDGKWIAYVSDKSGEDEIYIVPKGGKGKEIKITSGGETYKYGIEWSPDSKKILWGDRRQRLRYIDIQTKSITEVYKSDIWEIRSYNWSSDSEWITYSAQNEARFSQIYIYSLEENENYEVTDEWYDSSNPIFSDDGKYLFFTSQRDYNPIYSWTEWNHAYNDMDRVYFVTLAKETESPFKPKSDEVEVKSKDDNKDEKNNEKEKQNESIKVDIDGIKERIIGLPINSSNYWNINSIVNNIYYLRRGNSDERTQLMMFDLDKQKETELGQINGYEISADGKKMLVSRNGSYSIIDLPKSEIRINETLNLVGMNYELNKKEEWGQIFNEVWRQMREFFFDPNMHNVDWPAVRTKYEPLLEHVNHRNDLTYIIGEMIGELNIGHAYIGGGDRPNVQRITTGLLGAQLSKHSESGYFEITKILEGQSWDNNLISPLKAIGVDVKEGDFILAVDGNPVKDLRNIYRLLVNKSGKQVTLTVNSDPEEDGKRDVVVVPIGNESRLYYYNWVQSNIKKVDEASGGKIGYIHMPDMGVRGLNEFVKYFYPQIRKKALIIDVRGNGGGNVSPMIIERLRREIAMITISRNTTGNVNPSAMIYGPMACLADEFSASDGDIFTYRFKKHKLGKIIGKRTWGGVVGYRGPLPLIDGGTFIKPEFSRYDTEGKEWIMEGVGVEPDIYVDNDPAKEYAGIDEQLQKAIDVLMEELKTQEKQIPDPPPYPDKK